MQAVVLVFEQQEIWSDAMPTGHVIFLNGASSSGKTTIAHLLQERLEAPYLHLTIDAFSEMLPARFFDPSLTLKYQSVYRLTSGFYRCIHTLAVSENHVIVDTILWAHHLPTCLCALEHIPVLFVGVLCELDELERRERQRGDRAEGTARSQIRQIHTHNTYDITIDTTKSRSEGCTMQIIERLTDGRPFTAFQELRRQLRLDQPQLQTT